MNRNITEPFSRALPADRQGEFFHRYVLGVYDLYDRLTHAFPDILFESCASGGGRFDPGILAFAPQGWTSDDTDAIERLEIQWGTSLVYPLSSMGAHVSAVPNHQVGRVTPLATRAAVAVFGVFGYELDPTRLTPDERRQVIDQVAFDQSWRDLFQYGRFLRLVSPFEGDGNEIAWMVVAEDRRSAIAAWYQVLNRPVPGPLAAVPAWPRPDGYLSDLPMAGPERRLHPGWGRGAGRGRAHGSRTGPGPDLREAASLGDFTARARLSSRPNPP